MQVQKVNKNGTAHWVLLDDEMRLVGPVCEFLEFQRKIDRADNTLRAYAIDLKIYWEFLLADCRGYDEADTDVIADFVDYLRRGKGGESLLYVESCRTNRSINRILSSVRRFYRYAQMSGGCQSPIFFETIPQTAQMYHGYLTHTHTLHQTKKSVFKLKESRAKVRLVSPEDLNLFLGQLSRKRDVLLFQFLYFTGARIQEALDLEVGMVPQPDGENEIGVFRQIRSKGKKRDLYAPMSLIRALYAFVSDGDAPGGRERTYVFVSEKTNYEGRQLTYHGAYDIMRRAQKPLGMEFTFHDLRHTFCTRLIEQGMDVGIVQIVMGHANLYTTKRYLHMSDAYLMENLSQYWEAQEGGRVHE